MDGTDGGVPAPSAGEQNKFLKGNGTWSDVVTDGVMTLSGEQTVTGVKVFSKSVLSEVRALTDAIIDPTNWLAFDIMCPPSLTWENRTIPTLSSNKKDILIFITYDKGATWYGKVLISGV